MAEGTMVLPRTRTSRVPLRQGQGQVSAAWPWMSGVEVKGVVVDEERLTVAGLIEAVLRIAMRREDGDLVAAILQPDGGVDD
jgi:hypothetical protein